MAISADQIRKDFESLENCHQVDYESGFDVEVSVITNMTTHAVVLIITPDSTIQVEHANSYASQQDQRDNEMYNDIARIITEHVSDIKLMRAISYTTVMSPGN